MAITRNVGIRNHPVGTETRRANYITSPPVYWDDDSFPKVQCDGRIPCADRGQNIWPPWRLPLYESAKCGRALTVAGAGDEFEHRVAEYVPRKKSGRWERLGHKKISSNWAYEGSRRRGVHRERSYIGETKRTSWNGGKTRKVDLQNLGKIDDARAVGLHQIRIQGCVTLAPMILSPRKSSQRNEVHNKRLALSVCIMPEFTRKAWRSKLRQDTET
ncbi:hypothetical protein C8R44DRAFT_730384 [Mycena epipterygia]|nr:hypothetical protein C8R44DRAFT_730384 [Mycena epipterygia]